VATPAFPDTIDGRKLCYQNLLGWTKKLRDIFTYDMLVFPVNYNAHWSLAVVTNLSMIVDAGAGEKEKEGEETPKIFLMDSGRKFAAHSTKQIFKVLRTWLTSVWENTREVNNNNAEVVEGEGEGEGEGGVEVEAKIKKKKFKINAMNLPGVAPLVPLQDNFR